jgi:hypothetical protein
VEQGVDFVGLLNTQHDEGKGKEVAGDHPPEDRADEAQAPQASEGEDEAEMLKKGKLIDAEERKTGAVEWRVYVQYLLGCGGIPFLVLLFAISVCLEVSSLPLASSLLSILANSTLAGRCVYTKGTYQFVNLWLAYWSNHSADADTTFYLSIYLGVRPIPLMDRRWGTNSFLVGLVIIT